MEIEIDDPFLGKRTIGNETVHLIKDQLKLLEHFRDDGRVPSKHLLDDIKVYEFILKGDDPEKLANQYMDEKNRMKKNKESINNYEVADSIGWIY